MDFIGVSSSCINLREDPEILFVCLKKKKRAQFIVS